MLSTIKTVLKVVIGSFIIIFQFNIASTENVAVEVSSNKILNEVSDKFISFAVDLKILQDMHDESKKFDYMRMGKSLSPAYIRIAGPSTHEMSSENSVIRLKSSIDRKNPTNANSHEFRSDENSLTSLQQWNILLTWIKTANFTPFIALNNAEKIFNGNWNPKEAVKVLSMVDKMKLGECVWQLGYECADQTSEKYMNDLKTMKILMDAFTSRKNGDWKLASGDIHNCLGDYPSTELYSFLIRSSDFLDAVVLNSDVSVDPLDLLEEKDQKYIKFQYAENNAQLWTAVTNSMLSDDEETINWLNTLGKSAVNGYSIVFKELTQADFVEPTLSFYASLLHKKLVGSKVLEVSEEIKSVDVSVFAHCTNLQSILPGAITLFATNAGNDKSTVSIKMEVKENDREIIQYLLQQNDKGKIVVNGKVMNKEEDLKPKIVKVQELTFFMPPKSIAFWIVPMANIKACSVNKMEGPNTVFTNAYYKQLKNETASEILKRSIQEVSKESFKRAARSVEYHHNDETMQHELNDDQSRSIETLNIHNTEKGEKDTFNDNVGIDGLKNDNGFIDQYKTQNDFNNIIRKNIDTHDSAVFPIKDRTETKHHKSVTQPDYLIQNSQDAFDEHNSSTEFNADTKVFNESTVKSPYFEYISEGHEKVKNDIVETTELKGIEVPIEKNTADDQIFESQKLYQEILPCNNDGKNLTIIVIETTNSSTDPSFSELFAILGQIASMLELEKEFLDIGSAVLTPDSDNPLIESRSSGLKEFTILDHENTSNDDLKYLKPSVPRVKRETDEESVFDEADDQKTDEDKHEDVVGSPFQNLRFALPSLPQLPPLPRLPELSKPFRQRVPTKSIDDLVERAEQLMRNISPNLLDNARSESRLNPQFAKIPMDARAHDLNLKNQLAKNKYKIEKLRNKIQARMADYELKTKFLFNKDLKPSRLFKRDIKENTVEKDTTSNEKWSLNNRNQRKFIKPLFEFKKNIKSYFNKMRKSANNKEYFKGLSKHNNKAPKENSVYARRSLRMKRYVDNEVDKEEINNDIFGIDDFEYKDDIKKDTLKEKESNSILSNNNEHSNDHSGKVDVSTKLDSYKTNDKKKSDININENENFGIPCEAKTNIDNAIIKSKSLCENQDDSNEIPETKVRCLPSVEDDVQPEKFTWEDVKSKVGLSDDSGLNTMVSDITSFFQNFPKKIQEFWEKLGG